MAIRRNQNHKSLIEILNTYRMENMINVKLNLMYGVSQTLKLKEIQSFFNDTQYNFDLVLNECWYSDIYLPVGHR